MKHFHARRIIITTGITAILCTVTLIYTVGHIVCPLTSYANSNQNILSITPEDSTDMPLIHFDGVVSGGEWVISQDYNGMANPGHSRTTIKVDQNFTGGEGYYYDLAIEYYDASIGTIIVQSSTDESNVINYPKTGYGGYPEENFWSWSDNYYISNLAHELNNTNAWVTHTFRLTDEFFEKDSDNYIHLYFGRDINYGDTLRIKSISLTKHLFMIEPTSGDGGASVIGNIYSADNYDFGFMVLNPSDSYQNASISYVIINSEGNIISNKELGDYNFSRLEQKVFSVDKPNGYDTYRLIVSIEQSSGYIEKEEIDFSIAASDLSDNNNDFLGLNTFFGFSGWGNSRQIADAIAASKMLGINNIRYSINSNFVNEDLLGGYTDSIGRYGYIVNSLHNTYNQAALLPAFSSSSSPQETLNDIIPVYVALAQEYGDKMEYYEILNEPNLTLAPEVYAEVLVKTAYAIRAIDPDAKIISMSTNRVPIYGDNSTNYSDDGWIERVIDTPVAIDTNDDGIIDRQVYPLEVTDAISVHPYTEDFSMSPETDGAKKSVFAQLQDLRDVIEDKKLQYSIERNMPIWITEFNYPTSTTGATPSVQASYLGRMLVWALSNSSQDALNIEKVYIFALQDSGLCNNLEANFGIVSRFRQDNLKGFTRDTEMAAKPAYLAINQFSTLLNNATPTKLGPIAEYPESINAFEFINAEGKKVIVMWNNTADDVSVRINVPKEKAVAYDIYGNPLELTSSADNSVTMPVGQTLRYVVINASDNGTEDIGGDSASKNDNNDQEGSTGPLAPSAGSTANNNTNAVGTCWLPCIITLVAIFTPLITLYQHKKCKIKII